MKTSLYILFTCWILGATYARTDEEIKKWFVELGLECSKEFTVTGEELQQMQSTHKIPQSKNAKCLVACIFKKIDWITDKGMFDEAKAYEMASKEYAEEPAKIEKAKELYEICKKVNTEAIDDSDVICERAALLATCLTEHATKMGFSIQ